MRRWVSGLMLLGLGLPLYGWAQGIEALAPEPATVETPAVVDVAPAVAEVTSSETAVVTTDPAAIPMPEAPADAPPADGTVESAAPIQLVAPVGAARQSFVAKLRLINRQTEQTQDFVLAPGKRAEGGGLVITAQGCIPNAQGIHDNDMVFLTVEEDGARRFRGWVSRKFPEVSGLEHPVYTLLVGNCS